LYAVAGVFPEINTMDRNMDAQLALGDAALDAAESQEARIEARPPELIRQEIEQVTAALAAANRALVSVVAAARRLTTCPTTQLTTKAEGFKSHRTGGGAGGYTGLAPVIFVWRS
jgi:hypothetical protein